MNRLEVLHFFDSFFAGLEKARGEIPPPSGTAAGSFLDLVSSLKQSLPLSIPLLRDLAALRANPAAEPPAADRPAGVLTRRIDRCYFRLCRIQEDLGRLDFKKAPPDVSPEDYIFSRIDFSRYREIDERDFDKLFPEGLTDFDETFLKKNFDLARREIQSVIEGSYKKAEGSYKIQRENPLILSIMRTLETSLETSVLFTAREVEGELKNLLGFLGGGGEQGRVKEKSLSELLYPHLVLSLDNVLVRHDDGMTTKLFISPQGDLAGTFRPGDKPWTRILIPANANLSLSLAHN